MSEADFDIRGSDAIRDLGRALKSAGDGGELRKGLLRELRAAGKPITAAVRSDLGSKMPQRGGLAAHLAKAKVSTRNKLSGNSAGISIQTSVPGYDLAGIEKGTVRHPTFGHRPWVAQSVEANVITNAIDSKKNTMRDAVIDAIDSVLDHIDREAK